MSTIHDYQCHKGRVRELECHMLAKVKIPPRTRLA